MLASAPNAITSKKSPSPWIRRNQAMSVGSSANCSRRGRAGGSGRAYSFRMIFSAANLAAVSESKSSGVTKLDVVLPRMALPDRLTGVMAARQ
jgi:hypothetical protein